MELPKIAKRWGIANFFVKDDGRLPTGSFKDRASCVGATRAVELGYDTITCSSTGNAASSLAGFSANLGLKAYIFVPAHAPEAKVAQLRIFKSNVLLVEGTYDEAYYLCQDAAKTFGWYNRNCAINPVPHRGQEDLGPRRPPSSSPARIPDWVSVAVGDGCTIAGIWKGFVEMKRFGVIDSCRASCGVQAAGAQPIFEAWQAGDEKLRRSRRDARRLDRGRAPAQPDQGAPGDPRLGRRDGRRRGRGDPLGDVRAGAARRRLRRAGRRDRRRRPLARDLDGTVKPNETVLHVLSGNGLKDVRSAMRACPEARRIGVSLDDVRRVVAEG